MKTHPSDRRIKGFLDALPCLTPVRGRHSPCRAPRYAGLLLLAALAGAPLGALGQETHEVDHNWPLIPAGLSSGDTFRLLFLSDLPRHATNAEVEVYNTWIQERAAEHSAVDAEMAGKYRVLAQSVSGGGIRANTGTGGAHEHAPIYWTGGAKIADDYVDFWDGTWDSEWPVYQQNGEIHTGSVTTGWTGVTTRGETRDLCEDTTRQTFRCAPGVLGANYGALYWQYQPTANEGAGNRVTRSSPQGSLRRLHGLSPVFTVAESSDSSLAEIMVSGPDGVIYHNDNVASEPVVNGQVQLQVPIDATVNGFTITAIPTEEASLGYGELGAADSVADDGATIAGGVVRNFRQSPNPKSFFINAVSEDKSNEIYYFLNFRKVSLNNAFKTRWRLDNPNDVITIPTAGGGYDYTVQWRDDRPLMEGYTAPASRRYSAVGNFTVSVVGDFPAINFGGGGTPADCSRLRMIREWGDNQWETMEEAFAGCTMLTIEGGAGVPDLSGVTTTAAAFKDSGITSGVSGWDVGGIRDMSEMFSGAGAFNENLGAWDVSSVRTMDSMFKDAGAFNQNLGVWDISGVTDASNMLDSSALSLANYDATLKGWAAQSVNSDVSLGAAGRQYCDYEARQALTDAPNNWSISGDQVATATLCPLTLPPALISSLEYTVDGAIPEFTFPAGIGGITPLRYSLNADDAVVGATSTTFGNLPGLTFMHATRTLVGTPTAAASAIALTYTVSDSNTVADSTRASDQIGTRVYMVNVVSAEEFSDAFVTSWVVGAGESITIPTNGSGYNYDVRWDDNGIDRDVTGDATHTYTEAGTYQVSIIGDFPQIDFGGSTSDNQEKINSVDKWSATQWRSMAGAFEGCRYLTIGPTAGKPDLTNVTDMSGMFIDARALNQDIGHWDVSAVTDMRGMFRGASTFNQDISGWNVAGVDDMSSMFQGASAFNQNIGGWNVGAVENMNSMFQGATAFNQNIGGWNVGGVTRMAFMFRGAVAFNQNINRWDVTRVENMVGMFQDADSFNQNISGWEVGGVGDMRSMFEGAAVFNQNIRSWDVSGVNDMSAMFKNAVVFNQNISGWNVGEVENMDSMFAFANNFNQDINGWNVINVTNMSAMFEGANNFDHDLGDWDVRNVIDMSAMFRGADDFNRDIGGWDVSAVTDMSNMFTESGDFSRDLGAWRIGGVTTMDDMFYDSAMAIADYDATLKGWAAQPVSSGVALGARGVKYCDHQSRSALAGAPNNWNIADDIIGSIAECPVILPADADTNLSYSVGDTITDFIFPESGGITPTRYSLSGGSAVDGGASVTFGELPGLTYTPDTRTLSGTPPPHRGGRLRGADLYGHRQPQQRGRC